MKPGVVLGLNEAGRLYMNAPDPETCKHKEAILHITPAKKPTFFRVFDVWEECLICGAEIQETEE